MMWLIARIKRFCKIKWLIRKDRKYYMQCYYGKITLMECWDLQRPIRLRLAEMGVLHWGEEEPEEEEESKEYNWIEEGF